MIKPDYGMDGNMSLKMLGIPRGLNQLLRRDILAKTSMTVVSLGTHSEPMSFYETGELGYFQNRKVDDIKT